jgi:hypothetical protein
MPGPPLQPFPAETDVGTNRLDGWLAAVEPRSAGALCGVSAVVWMAGSWLAGWRVSVPGLQLCAGCAALAGAVLASVSGYVAIRSWRLRHR